MQYYVMGEYLDSLILIGAGMVSLSHVLNTISWTYEKIESIEMYSMQHFGIEFPKALTYAGMTVSGLAATCLCCTFTYATYMYLHSPIRVIWDPDQADSKNAECAERANSDRL